MKVLAVLSVSLACAAAQLVLPLPYAPLAYNAAPFVVGPVSSQFHAQDELGQFTFATAGDLQARVETKTFDGVVRGRYSYVDPTSKLVTVNYVADDGGYRVIGANNLPEAPAVPTIAGPDPVEDTPEVLAARADFQKKFEEAAAAAAAAPDTPVTRRRRSAVLYPAVLPAAVKATIKTIEAEPVDAATPADTKKIELKEKETEIVVPYAAPIAPIAPIAPFAPIAPIAPITGYAPTTYSLIAPSAAKTTIKYPVLEAVDAATPADTKKIELKEKEVEVVVPYTAPIAPLPLVSPHYVVL